jgi:aminoglycoside N3'-acetyltransferase
MTRPAVSQQELTQQLRELGVTRAGVLVVHTSFSKIAPVEGGPQGLIAALRSALGPDGTLVMPSMTHEDDLPFDVTASSCIEMGIVADTFWRMPGVLRSNNPHAFAAAGPHAERIVAPHPLDVPHGLDSPVGRAYELDGQVLLLGVGHDANTTVHLAENMAGVRYRRAYHVTVLEAGRAVRYDYAETDHCCENFTLMDEWLDQERRQRRGTVVHAEARLMRARDVVDVAAARLRSDELVFLHPAGSDDECDAARASMPEAV